MLSKCLCLSVSLLAAVELYSQSVENVKATLFDDHVTITYDLRTPIPDQEFTITLYSSVNNFTTPLTKVNGDVGPGIKPGLGKSINWEAKNELGDFDGEVVFEIRGLAILNVKPYAFSNISKETKAKRGKILNIEWSGGRSGDAITLQLMKSGQVNSTITRTTNTGGYSWQVPKNTAKGEYQLFMIVAGNTLMSEPFKIRAKTPAIVKIAPMILLGGTAYFFLINDGSGEGRLFTMNKLPAPPEPN